MSATKRAAEAAGLLEPQPEDDERFQREMDSDACLSRLRAVWGHFHSIDLHMEEACRLAGADTPLYHRLQRGFALIETGMDIIGKEASIL